MTEHQTERRHYDRSLLEAHRAYAIEPPTQELLAKAADAGWSAELLGRVLAVRPDPGMIESWIESGWPPPEFVEAWATENQRLLDGTLNIRTATWGDHHMVSDLCANSPETVGDWSVTVERSPNPFAQYRLQEHPHVTVFEDQRVAVAMSAASVRNTYIEGERTSTQFMSGWRVRDGFRGLGLSSQLQNAAGPGTKPFGLVSYWHVRLNNASASWIQRIEDDMEDRPEGFSIETNNVTASVWHFESESGMTDDDQHGELSERARVITEGDLDRCVELINRTHAGLDLFRPYSYEYLDDRLADGCWGPAPFFREAVYGWPDYRVIEVDGEIVACGGLWDRGRDVREVWETDAHGPSSRFVHDPTALMDFGFAEGHEGVMAELISHFVAESRLLGRSGILTPLEFLPEVREATDHIPSTVDTRELHVMPFTSPQLKIELTVSQPYTDMAYW